jgi:hypothetical protein
MSTSTHIRFAASVFLLTQNACHRQASLAREGQHVNFTQTVELDVAQHQHVLVALALPSCTSATALSPDARRFLNVGSAAFASARTATEQKAAIASQIPGGFAGSYARTLTERGEANTIAVLLRDTTQRAAAVAVLDTLLPRIYRRAAPFRISMVRPATWDFSELHAWYQFLGVRVPLGEDLVMTAIEESKNRIKFGVRDTRGRDRILRRLSELSLPCGLVVVEVTGPVIPTNVSGG